MKQIQPPRGTQDIIAPLSDRFRAHERRGAELFERAGYRPIITPMFEDTSLFVRGVGEGSDIVSKEMYTFTDRSDNSLTLRPEGTAPVMRAVLSSNLHQGRTPVKLWYSAAMFRYDRPQKGRYRQHHQLGIEAIGTEDPIIDAEVIALGDELLSAAGLSETPLLLNSIGHAGCREPYLALLKDWLIARKAELDEDCNRRIETNPLRVFDCKVPEDQKVLAEAPTITEHLCDECRTHFGTVQEILNETGVAFTIEPRLVRGLDYYTRTTFEFQTPHLESAQNTLCGGGRYDGLSELIGGPRLPGIGFGSGIERVLLAAEIAGVAEAEWRIACIVIPLEGDDLSRAVQLVRGIRAAGLSAEIQAGNRSIKDHMRKASQAGARAVVIMGPEERKSDSVSIRDMTSREQSLTPRSDVVRRLKELLHG